MVCFSSLTLPGQEYPRRNAMVRYLVNEPRFVHPLGKPVGKMMDEGFDVVGLCRKAERRSE